MNPEQELLDTSKLLEGLDSWCCAEAAKVAQRYPGHLPIAYLRLVGPKSISKALRDIFVKRDNAQTTT